MQAGPAAPTPRGTGEARWHVGQRLGGVAQGLVGLLLLGVIVTVSLADAYGPMTESLGSLVVIPVIAAAYLLALPVGAAIVVVALAGRAVSHLTGGVGLVTFAAQAAAIVGSAAMARIAALAQERARMAMELRRRLAVEEAQSGRLRDAQLLALRALREVATHIDASSTDLDRFIGRLSETVARLVPATCVVFLRLGEDGGLQPEPAAVGLDDATRQRLVGLACDPHGADVAGRVVFRDRVLRVGPHDTPVELSRRLGSRSLLAVSWRAGERSIGMLVAAGSMRHDGFTGADAWILQIAARAAGLVWLQQQYAARLADMRAGEAEALRVHAERMEELERVKGDFLRLASHELRGPISVARGYVSMLADGTFGPADGADVRDVLPIVLEKLDGMNLLIDQMLETARLEDSRMTLNVDDVDLAEVVAEAVRMAEELHRDRRVLAVGVDHRRVPVRGDRTRLLTVVVNLVDNALKYSPATSSVGLALECEDGTASVRVVDEGPGIHPADLDKLFTRFGRVVTRENSHIPGTGLGLYLSREIAIRHGGEITLWTAPGEGSAFTLRLPLAGPDPAAGTLGMVGRGRGAAAADKEVGGRSGR